MNAGEQLVSLSGATSGTALDHLMAITTGSGTWETIYAKSIHVTSETQQCFVQSIEKPVGAEVPGCASTGANESSEQKAYTFTADRSLVVTIRKIRNTVKE